MFSDIICPLVHELILKILFSLKMTALFVSYQAELLFYIEINVYLLLIQVCKCWAL